MQVIARRALTLVWQNMFLRAHGLLEAMPAPGQQVQLDSAARGARIRLVGGGLGALPKQSGADFIMA